MTSTFLPAPITGNITARGPLSAAVLRQVTGGEATDHRMLAGTALAASADVVHDDDIQLALFALYASSYGSLPELDAPWSGTLT